MNNLSVFFLIMHDSQQIRKILLRVITQSSERIDWMLELLEKLKHIYHQRKRL